VGSGLGNYTLGFVNGTLTVGRATLTVKVIDAMRIYGQPNPTFTVTYTGFVNGENANVLGSLPIAGTTAVLTSPVGAYPITVSGGASDNYTFDFIDGTLTIATPSGVDITSKALVNGHILISGTGDANVTYTIQASADLVHWQNIGVAASDMNGTLKFEDLTTTGVSVRFYRTSLP
jgi:hypothetical protein